MSKSTELSVSHHHHHHNHHHTKQQSNLPSKSQQTKVTKKLRKLKCVFIGDDAIGKTSLIVSYTTNGYPTEYVPTAFDTYSERSIFTTSIHPQTFVIIISAKKANLYYSNIVK
ncbi:hypothetical protein DERF_008777 [Dermatophagoides farinae]|uniref:Uncharacterized protein n=1 Tax=Dermatophagoides farinae TaxID=6954 RepID=A0A922I304_DERFA|nr:hypothetical protein DERF_008777 [Dermatophagoides farinae]